jgi:hypothetical protein
MTSSSFKKSALRFLTLLPLAFALTVAVTAVQAQTLQLNGTGIRQQASHPLYSAGLYLSEKFTSADEVMGSQGAKQLRVVMLRDVSAAEMGDLLANGIVANASDDELRQLIPTLFSIGKILGDQKKLMAGDSFQIELQPATATTITIDAKAQGQFVRHVFAEPDLFGTLLRIWLGNQPADAGLKSALLGKAG